MALLLVVAPGCAAKPSGNVQATKALLGKRIGLVVRASRYFGAASASNTKIVNGRSAIDAPPAVYLLANESPTQIQAGMPGQFELVRLSKYNSPVKINADLVMEGDLILISPNKQRSTLPSDGALRKIIEAEKLDGLLIVDELWDLYRDANLLSCTVAVQLTDARGNVVFRTETAGSKQYASFLQGLTSDITLGTVGQTQTSELVDAAAEASKMAGTNIAKEIQKFVGTSP